MAAPDLALFGRAAQIVVGTTDISGLDVAFDVKKSLALEPNTCDLKIWNLSPDTRKMIEAGSSGRTAAVKLSKAQRIAGFPASNLQKVTVVPVSISAGYVGGMSQVFLGELRAAQTVTEGADLVTELCTGDSDQALINSRISAPLGPGTTPDVGMRKILSALGIGQGNLTSALKALQTAGVAQMFNKGAALKGRAANMMSNLCKSAGLEWSVQDGQLQVLPLGQPLAGVPVSVSPDTGMIGSPTVDTKGILNVTTLIIPSIKPGVRISVSARSVKGNFRVISCNYVGDTMGNEWFCKIEASKFNA